MTNPPHLTLIKPKTVLTRDQIDTAWDLWCRGFGTDVIGRKLGLPEFAIWNCLDLIRGASEERGA